MYKLIGSDGKEYGPVSTEVVREWIHERRANGQTRVQRAGAVEWHTLSALTEFAADLDGRGAPPPLPGGPGSAVPSTGGPKTSRLAIASFVLGILGFCGVTAIVGMVLGIVARVQIRRSAGRLQGRGLALAGIILSVVMLGVGLVAAAVILPMLAKMHQQQQPFMGQADRTSDCGKNVRQVSLAIRLYADEHDGKCPPGVSWCDDITGHLNRPDILKCPRRGSDKNGFGLNARVAGRTLSSIPPDTVLLYETSEGWNTSGGTNNVIANPVHGRKFTFGFADGSVREVPKEELAELRWEP